MEYEQSGLGRLGDVVLVTPEQAAEWLKLNTCNRPFDPAVVEHLKQEILAGRWIVTDNGIEFWPWMVLLEGQHRLRAIVESGVAVPMRVKWNVIPVGWSDPSASR